MMIMMIASLGGGELAWLRACTSYGLAGFHARLAITGYLLVDAKW